MTSRTASCRCGQRKAVVTGEPVSVSACHCLCCQKRTGSAFSVQARWPASQVATSGHSKSWAHRADSGKLATHFFCPDCGSTVHYRIEGKFDGLVAIPLGAFGAPHCLSPRYSVWEKRRHPWLELTGDAVEHSD